VGASDFAEFYASSFRRVSSAVRAFCGDVDVAHEATQEAFARAYARWARLTDSEWPQAWVTTTAFNLTRRHHRRRPSTPTREPDGEQGPTGDRLDLLGALRSLPERQRRAIVLHYLLDIPVAGVADLMGISEGAIKAHLHKGRAALRSALEVRHA
jgi:RNA polymerase sigma-70 factor (ECF subfamily)